MNDIIETSKNGKYRVRLEIMEDGASFNPRTNQECNLANVITPKGQRYIDVDEDGGPLQDGWDRIHDHYVNAVPVFARWARIFHGITVVEDRPYDGAWSLWYVTPENLAETTMTAEKTIEAEVKEYRAWAEGEVYGFVVEKLVTRILKDEEDRNDPDLVDEETDWEHVDSVWGHVGREYAEQAARDALAPYAKGDAK